jgi:neural cell adhesion molecule
VYVTCVSRGGNPLPKIKWTLSDGSEPTAAKTQTIIYSHESLLELVLERKHHDQVVTCQAANSVGSLSQSVKLRVGYLPSRVDIQVVEPASKELQVFNNISIKAGTRAVFSCRAPNSNPKAEITWFKNGFQVGSSDSVKDGRSLFSYGLNFNFNQGNCV